MNNDMQGRQGEKKKVDSGQLSVVRKKPEDYFFRASAEDFKKIPGSPIAYWVSKNIIKLFDAEKIQNWTISDGQNKTANNDKFVRNIWEVSESCIGRDKKWLPYAKGGNYRKWYGNREHLVDWSFTARTHYRKDHSCRIVPEYLWYERGITWTLLASVNQSFRILEANETFDMTGSTLFLKNGSSLEFLLAFLNSNTGKLLNEILNPTLALQIKNVRDLPIIINNKQAVINLTEKAVLNEQDDWNMFETSLSFTELPLLHPDCHQTTLTTTYTQLRNNWQETTLEMQRLEEENNRIFIEAYGLQDELTPEVPLKEITLTCNPHYRYKLSGQWLEASAQEQEAELERRLRQDTMKEFLSYAVGCMFGRYSLDKPSLILANQGETIEDYLQQIPKPSFPADADNVIPILDKDWFVDDITSRFSEFLKTTFGTEHYEENLKFITNAIGKDIRKYFLKDFYKDHLKTYKKRPIYWLFSSPKGSFNALIYMHRYRPDTVSVILNDYLREFRTKLQNAQENLEQLSISADATKTEKTKALKQIEKLKKTITELDTYENETLYPLATQNIEIDLDDGVKVNYKKFGKALKKVPGLS